MANQRNIKNRIKSIKNTKKITSTMEMVASAKMKKVQIRLEQSQKYEEKINDIMGNILKYNMSDLDNPLFKENPEPKKILVLQILGNRGLCGSFNTNVIYNTMNFMEKSKEKDIETLNYVVGKKAITYYKFINVPVFKSMMNPEDKVSLESATKVCNELRDLFLSGEVHEVYISYTKVLSRSSQRPNIFRLLPVTPAQSEEDGKAEAVQSSYIFDPDPVKVLNFLLPLYLNVKVYNCFLESSYSEQFARRVAMKNATDASGDIIKDLTITYNRARQAKITNEIAEIVGGAAALE